MDISFHIILIVILAGLFFIHKFSSSYNPMIFVIIISIIGLISIMQSDTYIINGWNVTGEYNTTSDIFSSTTTPLKENFNYQWALILTYLFALALAVINWLTGEEYNEKRN